MLQARFFLAFIAFSALLADTYPRQPNVDVLHYTFRLALSDNTDEISGQAAVDVRFLVEGTRTFNLDLASQAEGKGMVVGSVSSNGAPLQFVHQNDRLQITLAPPPSAGERRRIVVQYRGKPRSGLRIGPNKFGERTFFSENWPDKARQWLPMIDHPYDKATSEFLITAPDHYQVVANGVMMEQNDLGDGRRETHWKQSVPIASWLNAVGVAQMSSRHFGRVQGIPLETWVFHQDRDAGIATFDEPARRAMEFYSDHIGPFPYEKLANVEAAGVTGGMEHATAIFYGEKSVTGKPAWGLAAHEIAHQWFGDSVTEKDWDDVWLSEGFATYFTLLNTEHWDGREAFVAGLKRSREQVLNVGKKLPDSPVVHNNLQDMKKVLNPLIYQKGGWTLHMLRGFVGDDRFWAGIRAFYATYRDKNCDTDDFRRVMEEISGVELKWFFEQWLKRPGSPSIEGTWNWDGAGKRLGVEVAQTQEGEAYRLPLDIGVRSPAGWKVEHVEITRSRQSFEISADVEPGEVVLDPNTWLLAQISFHRE